MEEIKVGEYVRTSDGIIGKITDTNICEICGEKTYIVDINYQGKIYHENNIIKHSFNIIDLIEIGDYVNGFEIDEFDDTEGNIYLGIPIYTDGLMNCIDEFRPINTIDIKSIVTKEQFKSIEYRLEDKK